MRKTVVTLLYIVGSVSATAQSTQNYVMSQARNTNNALMTTYQYYDGMGRPFEKVQVGVTSTNKNLIWLTDYDGLGRESKEWLPYENSSSYLSGSTVRSSAVTSYSDQKPYLQNVYEASPLNRINEVKEQGQLWHSHPKQIEYLHNTTSYPLSCKDYKVNISGTVSMNGIYGADMLSVKKMTDEDGHITYEFRDKQDRLILQRCMLSTDNSADTYYAYDYRGNLCYVLQPEYQNNADLNLFAFQYKYDSRHNVIEKKLPGADPIKYAYDKANRLIFSQDGVQRQQYCLTFMLYDIHGRLVLKGSSTSVTLPNVSSTFVYANKGTSGGIGTSGYTTNLSLVSPTVEQAHYYDDYTFKVNALGFGNSAFTNGTVSAKGLETGKRIATLQSTPSNYYSVMHYDIKGRNTKTVSTNQLNGTETVTTTYGYTDLPQTVTHVHTASGLSTQTEVMTYTYDQADRELTVTHKLNNNATVTLKSNSYDKYGRLQTCNLMNSETVTYGYNIRSWLTNISSTNFTESLLYFGAPNQCFNGNISRIIWKQNSASTTRGYDFTYDPLNRLTSAVYGESTYLQSNVNRYTTNYTYDKNGNFLTITRNGLKDGGVYGLIDDLTFTYDGNQVTKIEDAAIDPTYNGAFNFNDGASQTDEYVYDKNGNLTKDLNKNILSVQYNSLNLPSRINYQNGNYVTYTYSAEGERLTSVFNVGTGGYSEIYCGNIMYNNGTLKRILVDGGFITFSGSTPVYYYYLKDHLGSNNVVVNASGTVKQVNNYYPFGGISGESISGSIQAFKYNGKEFDRMNGLDWYDYGARQMSPDIGRFTTMDPMAEKYYNVSPYAYCHNNPINRIDPNGEYDFENTIEKNTNYTVVAVLPTGYANNQAMRKDHDAAIAAGIPVMVVDNVEDFADAMSALDALNSTTQIYTLNSHGYAGSFNIGSDEINANTDFSKLRQGLDNKMVFIGACNVGDLAKGSELLEKMSSQTASTVIAPSHRVASGYKYDGTSLNRSIRIPLSSLPNDNEFLLSKKGTSVEVIKNVHISNLGIGWDVSSGRTTPPLPNIKNIIHHNWK